MEATLLNLVCSDLLPATWSNFMHISMTTLAPSFGLFWWNKMHRSIIQNIVSVPNYIIASALLSEQTK